MLLLLLPISDHRRQTAVTATIIHTQTQTHKINVIIERKKHDDCTYMMPININYWSKNYCYDTLLAEKVCNHIAIRKRISSLQASKSHTNIHLWGCKTHTGCVDEKLLYETHQHIFLWVKHKCRFLPCHNETAISLRRWKETKKVFFSSSFLPSFIVSFQQSDNFFHSFIFLPFHVNKLYEKATLTRYRRHKKTGEEFERILTFSSQTPFFPCFLFFLFIFILRSKEKKM